MWQTMILVGSQFRGSALLNLEKIDQNHVAFLCTLIRLEVFICHESCHTASRYCSTPLAPVTLKKHFLIMASPSKLSLKTSLCNNPKPHVFETFDPAEDYESFRRHIILPIIRESHDYQSIHYTKKPTLPPPVVFAPDRRSIESVYQLILDTNVNLTNITPFVHYVGYPPRQSASIPIARCLTSHGYLSPSIPGCVISNNKETFLKGNIVVLGLDTCWKVVMEGIIEVGRHFILYEVKEVGSIPMGGVWITQLVTPLNSHPSVLLHFLLLIIMAFFPCFFWSSAEEGTKFRVALVILHQWFRYCWKTFFL